ncbi:MAG: cadherin-like domain-containing protein [Pirellulales bacterium]
MRSNRSTFRPCLPEQLEERRVMTATPLDLDLSTVETQSVFVGESLSFNLFDTGGSFSEGEPGDRELMMQLDPDSDETPLGASMSFDGTFSWTPTESQAGLHRIRVIAVENGQPQQADVEDLFIDVQLGRPEIDLNGVDVEDADYSTVFHVGRSPVAAVSSELAINDMNNDSLVSAKIEMINRLDGELEQLSVDTSDTAITIEVVENSLLLSGEDSIENYERVIQSLVYTNSHAEADPTSRLIEITVNDGQYESLAATSMIAINYAPDMAVIENQTVNAGESIQIDVPAMDINLDQTLAFLLDVESPSYVSLSQEPDTRSATLTISPEMDHPAETVVVRLLVLDQYGLADSQSFELSISPNEASLISEIEDQIMDEGSEAAELAFTVSDAETSADALLVEATTDNPDLIPLENIVITGSGEERTVTATPVSGQVGQALVTVAVSDGVNVANETFTVTVNEVNSAPTAVEDSYATSADTRLSISPVGVLTNDTHSQGDLLTVTEVNGDSTAVGSPMVLDSGAELTLNADGSFSYDPSAKFDELSVEETGSDSFQYTIADSDGETSSATVDIVLQGVNEAPVAADDAFSTDANTALTIAPNGVINNDQDIDNGDVLTVVAIEGSTDAIGIEIELASGALLSMNADGSLTYDPNGQYAELAEDQSAVDSFSYEVADLQGSVSTAIVEIEVTAPTSGQDQNAPPINKVPSQQELDSNSTVEFSVANSNAISVSDADAGSAIIEASIRVDSGSLTLSDGYINARHKLVGTISQINHLLEGMVYQSEVDFVGNVSLTIISNDLGNLGLGGARSDSDTVLIVVNQPVIEPLSVDDTLSSDLIDTVFEDELAVDDLIVDSILDVYLRDSLRKGAWMTSPLEFEPTR